MSDSEELDRLRQENELLKQQAEEVRKCMEDEDREEESELKIPSLPSHTPDSNLTETIKSVITGNHPPPDEIPFDVKNLDGVCIDYLRQYDSAAAACFNMANNATGVGCLYFWRRGEFYERTRAALFPAGKWKKWCADHKQDKSKISRDRTLYKNIRNTDELIGLSGKKALDMIRAKKPKKQRPVKKPEDDFLKFIPPQEAPERPDAVEKPQEAPAQQDQPQEDQERQPPEEKKPADLLTSAIEALTTAWENCDPATESEEAKEVMKKAVMEADTLVKKFKRELGIR